MSDSQERRRRWVTLGELIALAALIVSGLGLWLTWKGSQQEKPTQIVEQKQAVPLALRGTTSKDGKNLTIAPVDESHALDALIIEIPGTSAIELGSDGNLSARQLEEALKGRRSEEGRRTVRARITTRYVEMGHDRTGVGNYDLQYHWEDGGLFAGRSLRIDGMRRG